MPTGDDLVRVARRYLGVAHLPPPHGCATVSATGFDAGEFVEWVALMAGSMLRLPDTPTALHDRCRAADLVVAASGAARIRGALLFSFRDADGASVDPQFAAPSHSHVALSLGDARSSIEAVGGARVGAAIRGLRLGTDRLGRDLGRFDVGALVPGIDYPGLDLTRPNDDAPSPGCRLLARGSTGDDVAEAERMLREIGAPSLVAREPTPRFHAVTEQAVVWFQRRVIEEHGVSSGVRVTKQIGPATWRWLERYVADRRAEANPD